MCLTPLHIQATSNRHSGTFPCGKCPECKSRRASAWSFRLTQEDKKADISHFITLTYDITHVPITKRGYMSLQKSDVQKYFKRLRKLQEEKNKKDKIIDEKLKRPHYERKKIKYYAVGEYGTETMRPHYHLILFNTSIELIQEAWKCTDKECQCKGQNYLGQVHYGKVSGASVGYTLKYISKEGKIPMHRNDDRIKEFSLMSKGLGADYLTDNMKAWHKQNLKDRMYCNLTDGKKISMPRYYKDKIYTKDERMIISAAHQEKLKEQEQEEELKALNDTNYLQNKIEGHKAAFDKMHYKAKQGTTL